MNELNDYENNSGQHHISYKEYQRKLNKKPHEGVLIFVSTFFALLLLFLGIAKQISPEVDVQIGDENYTTESDTKKTAVDDRLKLLQQEDNGTNQEDDIFEPELDEKVKIPDNLHKSPKQEEEVISVSEKEAAPSPQETAAKPPVQPESQNVTAPTKVVVGYYSTREQAEVAKGIIAESGLNISPFVRTIGGAYTIQAGSYSSREKAQSVVNELLKNNFPARILVEQ